MTIQEAQQRLIFQLYHIYEDREAANIADLVMEHITGWNKIDRVLNKRLTLLSAKIALLEKYTQELLSNKPVQYVLNESWFFGLKFFVNESVLIPRPETEELVEWTLTALRHEQTSTTNLPTGMSNNIVVCDIGTGSGCISVAIKKNLPFAEVYACDISKTALQVAQQNATVHEVDIGLLHINFLDTIQWANLPPADIIISNPPYVPVKDKETMRANVLQYEPHVALFVENNDPLIFYRAIADFAIEKLTSQGSIYVEIHENLAQEVQLVFEKRGFKKTEVKKDMQGKDRMIWARK